MLLLSLFPSAAPVSQAACVRMLPPVFTFNLGHRELAGRVTVGRYDGKHPCLTAATVGEKVGGRWLKQGPGLSSC